jgi:acyl-CoA synthetase (NDP forming)
VISSVPLRFVEQLVEDCGVKHVKVLHFFTAGFSETGDEEATALEARVLSRAKEFGIRVIGPNCMGCIQAAGGLSFMPSCRRAGPIALLSRRAGERWRVLPHGAVAACASQGRELRRIRTSGVRTA